MEVSDIPRSSKIFFYQIKQSQKILLLGLDFKEIDMERVKKAAQLAQLSGLYFH